MKKFLLLAAIAALFTLAAGIIAGCGGSTGVTPPVQYMLQLEPRTAGGVVPLFLGDNAEGTPQYRVDYGVITLNYTWSPSTPPSVSGYRITHTRDGVVVSTSAVRAIDGSSQITIDQFGEHVVLVEALSANDTVVGSARLILQTSGE